MNHDKLQDLIALIDRFIQGGDRSMNAANRIEGLLCELFPKDDRFDDAIVALSSYQPGGGDYLYDEQRMTSILIQTKQLMMM